MIAAIILARLDSSRLPGKALLQLGGKRLIEWPIDALLQMKGISPILATTSRISDNPFTEIADQKNIPCFRGSKDDIAQRIIGCCEEFGVKYFFRINGDSPFVNLPLLEKSIKLHNENETDLISNLINRSYPYGLSCELIRYTTFRDTYYKLDKSSKEHITKYYYENLKEFNFAELPSLDNNYSTLNWTVDTKEDLLRLQTYLNSSLIKDIHNESVTEIIADYITIMKETIND